MKIGMLTDSLSHLSFEAMLDTAAIHGIEGVEFNAANWTSAPHMNLKGLLAGATERKTFTSAVASRGLSIIALNADWQVTVQSELTACLLFAPSVPGGRHSASGVAVLSVHAEFS